MPPARNRRPSREKIRADLLRSAESVFAEQGFEAASVETLAERAGYSTGAIYSNFAGKEELFLALLDERMTARTEEIRRAVQPEADVDATLGRGAGEFMQMLQQDSQWFLLLFEFWTYAARRPAFRERFAAHYRAIHAALTEVVEMTAERLGLDLGVSPAEAAMVIKALSNGFALESIADPGAVPPDLFGRTLVLLARGAQTPGGP
jgi:AcrR family transcriptional regulator